VLFVKESFQTTNIPQSEPRKNAKKYTAKISTWYSNNRHGKLDTSKNRYEFVTQEGISAAKRMFQKLVSWGLDTAQLTNNVPVIRQITHK
jgi:hypothetical protein